MRGRIAIDMDEVIVDTLPRHIGWYVRDHGPGLHADHIQGRRIYDVVPAEHVERMRDYTFHPEFFADLEVMTGALEAVETLSKHYEIFIATAAMDYPHSFLHKYAWLQKHLPFIPPRNYVYCGDKSIIHADFLIDDSPTQLEVFSGTPILFSAPHNLKESRFRRVRSWAEVLEVFA